MREGAWGNLKSTYPPVTLPAWPSSITGVNPGKLGISYFVKNNHDYDSNHFVSTDDMKAKAIWDYMGQADRKSIILNLPYLYPPRKINGIMVSYLNTRGGKDRISTYPPDLAKELFSVLGLDTFLEERVNFGQVSDFSRYTSASQKRLWLDRLVAFHRAAIDKLEQAVLYLMRNYEWDFFMVVFNSTMKKSHS